MRFKPYLLGLLCLATVTSCADATLEAKMRVRHDALMTGKIADGACDDVGQFIPRDAHGYTSHPLEASAMPLR